MPSSARTAWEAALSADQKVKLAVAAGYRVPDLVDVAAGVVTAPRRTRSLTTTYFDTDDLRLTRSGVSLRERAGEGWTLSLPVHRDAGRAAPALRFPANGRRPPAAVLELLRGYLRSQDPRPVVRLRTTRTVRPLLSATGEVLAQVVDDRVSVIEGGRRAAGFRELVVDLEPEARPKLGQALVARLRAAGASAPDPTPKLVRALGARGAEPDGAAARPLGGRTTAGDVIRNAIAASTTRLLQNDPLVRLGKDPEGVHQARVATRRLRSDLRTFSALLDPQWVEGTREELRWLGELLGRVRDLEVQSGRLRERLTSLPPEDRPAARTLLANLGTARAAARRALLRALNSERYLALLERLLAAAAAAPLMPAAAAPAKVTLIPAVREPWQKLKKWASKLDQDATDLELHELRIRAKRSRYAAEALAPVVPRAAEFAAAVAGLQSVLGEHQDAVVAQQWLRDAAARGGMRVALAAGELLSAERAAQAAARAGWRRAWARARKRRLRDWLRAG